MGLGFSFGDAGWSYSGFNAFRKRLAMAVGIIDLRAWWNANEEEVFLFDTREPLWILLNHSDCGGELTPNECRRIAPRLREIILDKGLPGPRHDPYDEVNALKLAHGMDLAVLFNKPLEFC